MYLVTNVYPSEDYILITLPLRLPSTSLDIIHPIPLKTAPTFPESIFGIRAISSLDNDSKWLHKVLRIVGIENVLRLNDIPCMGMDKIMKRVFKSPTCKQSEKNEFHFS